MARPLCPKGQRFQVRPVKFRPRVADDSVNVSKGNPLREFCLLFAGLAGVVFAGYMLLALLTSWAIKSLPLEAETWLGEMMVRDIPGKASPALQKRLDALLEHLPKDSPLRKYKFRVYLLDTDEANAVALPGGAIVVYKGLLNMLDSENELSMVLGHELGHFAHRDHLRRLGKGLVLNAAMWLIFGKVAGSEQLLFPLLAGLDSRYSKGQEEAADAFGLRLLYLRYGHVAGATEFFRKILEKDDYSRFKYLLSTHPDPKSRMEHLKILAQRNGWPEGRPAPLGPDLKALLEKNDSKK